MTGDVQTRFGHATLGVPPPMLDSAAEEPVPVRRRGRRIALVIASAVVLLLGVFLLGRAVGGRGQVEVWQLRHDLAAGAGITATDLSPVHVDAAAATRAAPASAVPNGRIARDNMRAGQLLPRDLLVPGTRLPRSGQVLVGVATPAGAAPDGLRAGDSVDVLRLPATSTQGNRPPDLERPAEKLLARVEVYSVTPTSPGSVVTLVIPSAGVNAVTSLNAQNRLALVELP